MKDMTFNFVMLALQKIPQMNNTATRQMVSFPDQRDLIHRSIWDKVCRKHLKRREGRKRKKKKHSALKVIGRTFCLSHRGGESP